MKQYKKKITLLLFIGLFTISSMILTGCENKSINTSIKKNDNTYTKDFGSYEVLDGWIENEEHSTNSKFFYVLDGTEDEAKPNNISINSGINKYAASEHLSFKDAILRQLSYQISGQEKTTLNASGSYTDNNYVVYTFIIAGENVTTTQYYIVGDYKYILIHETVYGTSKETDEAAKKMVNTFKWND